MTAVLPGFEAIWSAIPYPAFVLDAKDRVIAANSEAEALAQRGIRQMRGRDFAALVGADSPVISAIGQARRGGVSVALFDIDVTMIDSRTPMHSLHAAPLGEGQGEILLLMHPQGIAEKMDRSLANRSAVRSVTGMAAMLAHEIKNPLAGISGAAQLLEMSLGDAERELTALIREEAARIVKLVERVEQFGDLRPAPRQPVNIHDVLDRARRSAQAGFGGHIRFIEDYDPSLPPVPGDPDQLLQVFQNLIKNAAEAAPRVGGTITLSTAFRPGVKLALPGGRRQSLPMQVTVADNGPGIPDNLIRDVFDPFVSSKAHGSGLGLSLVSKFVTDHGGVVDCDSRPGLTRFRVRLPVWQEAGQTGARAAAATEEG